MSGIDAFVAKLAAQFKDTIHSATHEPLQEQLGGNAQIQIHVVRVDVRNKRPRIRATMNRLQNGSFCLQIPRTMQVAPHRVQHRGPRRQRPARLSINGQVDVPGPHPRFRVGKPISFVGQRVQGFRFKPDTVGQKRRLTLPRDTLFALNANNVGKVKILAPGFIIAAPSLFDDHLCVA